MKEQYCWWLPTLLVMAAVCPQQIESSHDTVVLRQGQLSRGFKSELVSCPCLYFLLLPIQTLTYRKRQVLSPLLLICILITLPSPALTHKEAECPFSKTKTKLNQNAFLCVCASYSWLSQWLSSKAEETLGQRQRSVCVWGGSYMFVWEISGELFLLWPSWTNSPIGSMRISCSLAQNMQLSSSFLNSG